MNPSQGKANSWYHKTISQFFSETCAKVSDKPAIIYRNNITSYGSLWNRVQHVAQGMLELGIKKGDVVSVLPAANVEFAVVYFATLQIGAVANPLNLLWGSTELHGVLSRNRPKLIVTTDTHGSRNVLDWLHDSLPDFLDLNAVVYVGQVVDAPEGWLAFSQLEHMGQDVDAQAMAAMVRDGRPTDIQVISQSSGTTGLSKSALWDHRTPLASAHFVTTRLRLTEDDLYLNMAPFFHNSGMFSLVANLAFNGSTLVLMDSFNANEALRLVEEHSCTSTFGFDAHWNGIKKLASFSPEKFTIRKAMIAGDARTYDLVRSMCGSDAALVSLYGQTESGGLVAMGEPDCMDEDINRLSHGRPLPGVRIVIKDVDTGEPISNGTEGAIWYRSPHLFRGYLNQEEETRAAFDENGYFCSGDYGNFQGGHLTFLGRLGGVIKSGGENVSTVKVTNLLLDNFPEIFDGVHTLGVEDPYWGAKVVAFVRMRPGKIFPGTELLRQECKGKMAAYEVPREFLEWEEDWPMSPEGKIDAKRLKIIAIERLEPDFKVSSIAPK